MDNNNRVNARTSNNNQVNARTNSNTGTSQNGTNLHINDLAITTPHRHHEGCNGPAVPGEICRGDWTSRLEDNEHEFMSDILFVCRCCGAVTWEPHRGRWYRVCQGENVDYEQRPVAPPEALGQAAGPGEDAAGARLPSPERRNPCVHLRRGRCRYGETCRSSHDLPDNPDQNPRRGQPRWKRDSKGKRQRPNGKNGAIGNGNVTAMENGAVKKGAEGGDDNPAAGENGTDGDQAARIQNRRGKRPTRRGHRGGQKNNKKEGAHSAKAGQLDGETQRDDGDGDADQDDGEVYQDAVYTDAGDMDTDKQDDDQDDDGASPDTGSTSQTRRCSSGDPPLTEQESMELRRLEQLGMFPSQSLDPETETEKQPKDRAEQRPSEPAENAAEERG